VLITGPGSGNALASQKDELAQWLKDGGHLLAIGCNADELNSFLPDRIETKNAEHISTFFEPLSAKSFGAGIGPADLHNRAPNDFPMVVGGAEPVGNGVLAQSRSGGVILCQVPPWHFDDQHANTKKTFRRISFTLDRLLANLGVAAATPLLERFHHPIQKTEERWLSGYYIDTPQEWDDPYRHFRW
jgi:hypothetical protein